MKKGILLFALMLIFVFACQKEEMPLEEKAELASPLVELPSVSDTDPMDCTDLKTVPLKGYTIEAPFFNEEPIFCGPIPYPNGFNDVGGEVSHLGDVTGGYIEFLNCNPGIFEGVPVFIADFRGVLMSANGDEVFYEGSLTFDPSGELEGKSMCYITGGTGRWDGARGCFRYYDITPQEDGTLLAPLEGKITPPGIAKKNK